MSNTRRMAQRRSRQHGTFMWKTIKIPDLRFNSDKIKQFYTIEHKHRDTLKQRKGNVANFVLLPSTHGNISVIHKEVYMPFISRHGEIFLNADKQYNQGIRKIGGTVVNDKDIKKIVGKKPSS